MTAITVTRIDGRGRTTGLATLAVSRDDEFVYVKLGMLRVRVPHARWRALTAPPGSSAPLVGAALDALTGHVRTCRACGTPPGPACVLGADLRAAVLVLAGAGPTMLGEPACERAGA